MKVVIVSEDSMYKFIVDRQDIQTVKDIREYIIDHLDINNILIYYKDNVLEDSTPLSSFFNCTEFVFKIGSKDDILNKDINRRDSIISTCIDQSNNIFINKNVNKNINKNYNIKSRMGNIVKKMKYINKDDLLKILIFSFLLLTDNSELVFILFVIYTLQMISRSIVLYKDSIKSDNQVCKTFYMFFASMFLIDHNRF